MKINLKKLIEKYSDAPDDLMTAIQDWQKEQNCAPTQVSMQEVIPIIFELYTQLVSEQNKEKTDAEEQLEKLQTWKKSVLWVLREVEDNSALCSEVRNKAKSLRWNQEIQ